MFQGPEFHENGIFAWVIDPDGNKIELWEPKIWDEKNREIMAKCGWVELQKEVLLETPDLRLFQIYGIRPPFRSAMRQVAEQKIGVDI